MTITPLREIQLHWTDIFESYQISCSSCQELGLCEWESICSWVQNLSPFLSCSWNNQNRSVQKLSSEKADGEQSPVSAPIVNWCESQPRHPLPALGGRRRRKGFLQWDSSGWFLNHLRIHTGCIAICLSWHDFSIADCWDRLDLIDSQCLWEGVSGHKDRNGGNWVGECPSYMEMGFYRLVMYETGIHIWMGTG